MLIKVTCICMKPVDLLHKKEFPACALGRTTGTACYKKQKQKLWYMTYSALYRAWSGTDGAIIWYKVLYIFKIFIWFPKTAKPLSNSVESNERPQYAPANLANVIIFKEAPWLSAYTAGLWWRGSGVRAIHWETHIAQLEVMGLKAADCSLPFICLHRRHNYGVLTTHLTYDHLQSFGYVTIKPML